jgi:hypothetical protein
MLRPRTQPRTADSGKGSIVGFSTQLPSVVERHTCEGEEARAALDHQGVHSCGGSLGCGKLVQGQGEESPEDADGENVADKDLNGVFGPHVLSPVLHPSFAEARPFWPPALWQPKSDSAALTLVFLAV